MNKRSDDTCTKEAKFLSILIYKTTDGLTKVNVTFDEDTGWLSLTHCREKVMCKLCTLQILKVWTFYNPDVTIAVGYRVKSQRGETSIPPLSPVIAGFEFRTLCVPNLFTEWHCREISPRGACPA